jgi:outer membrane lipoprotein-sorting protein
MSLRPWDRASRSPVPVASRRSPELAALPSQLPTLEQLFTFARDAELRFETLRLQIEVRAAGSRGEQRTLMDVLLRHPGEARVTTSDPTLGTRGNFDVWLSDGQTVRTFSGQSRVGTNRPVRRRVRGLADRDLPGSSTVYVPITDLEKETLPEAFIHPAGLCQNVLATGASRVAGTAEQNGREAVIVECDHPRSVDVSADRPDHQLQVWFDRETGVISRLIETIAGQVTRDAVVTVLEPDVALPPSAFSFTFPSDARMVF